MQIDDLGQLDYRRAWEHQERCHAAVVAGEPERLIVVEHPPVITLGRRPGVVNHLVASEAELARVGVDVVQSDRGGDITFHGPGQLVAYPIIRLAEHRLMAGSYVRALERGVIATLAEIGISTREEPGAIGVWTDGGAKICALGVRIRRGVTLHGIALNVTTDLKFFDMIIPCGLAGRAVTSVSAILGDRTPSMPEMKERLARNLMDALR